MVNALRVLADVIVRLPRDMSPETTEGREPFIHPHHGEGEEATGHAPAAAARLRDRRAWPGSGASWSGSCARCGRLHPKARIELEVKESYRNMREGIAREPRVTAALEEATRRAGLEPRWVPIRGGTDGSRLTAMGLPTPNVFGGGQNFHGPTEWLSVEGLEKSLATVRHLVEVWVELSTPGSSRAAAAPRRRAPGRAVAR